MPEDSIVKRVREYVTISNVGEISRGYFVMNALGSDSFTIKILMIAMIGYLIVPHLYYYLNVKAEQRYEQ